MARHDAHAAMERLAVFVGEWRMVPRFKDLPTADGARVVFEWMPGGRFLIQRWEVPDVPEAPDGLAVIGPDPESEGHFLQHYFDTRGVARVYRMSLADGVWRLWRDTPDFSPLKFHQRFAGTFSEDGDTIDGAFEICHDGTTWEHDFDATYTRVT